VFKLWSAIQSEQETILIGSPHGGGYGAYKNHAFYNHETSILDYYFTWGWNKESKFSKNIPMPASKIINCKKISFDKKIHGILWGTTTTSRYIIDYSVGNFFFNDYLNWQKRFLCSLSSDLYKEILLRPHREDNGWNIAGRLTGITSKIQIKSWKDGSFFESLCDCRIYVCDHLATTYIESLSHNKPTILFWNPENHIMTDEARYYFNILKDSGILFETPELAAAKVSQIYDNVWEWWNEPNRQKAVKDFLDKFALVVDDPTKQWKDKILLLESN
jgi:putative transferase (TIGR04331 family)